MFMLIIGFWNSLSGKKTQIIAISISIINGIILLCDNGIINNPEICNIAKQLLVNNNQINGVGIALMAITLGSRIKRYNNIH